MSIRGSANPSQVWKMYAIGSIVVVAASLTMAATSGDRTTIVLTLWCDLVALAAIAAATYAFVAPQPHRESEAYGASDRGGHLNSADSTYRGTWL